MRVVKVVLNKSIKKLGNSYDCVSVKRGFAMNYLLPNGFANLATADVLKIAEKRAINRKKTIEEVKKNAEEIKNKIDGKNITITKKSSSSKKNENSKLYASVNIDEITAAIKDEFGVFLPNSVFNIPSIKKTGTYDILVNIDNDIKANIELIVKNLDKK